MTITALPRMGSGRVSETKRLQFHADVREVVVWMRQYVARLGFAPVARSWLYALESEGVITKGDFNWAGKWLADRRKEGLIPFELVGADSTRALTGDDVHDEEETPREYINRQLRDSLEQAKLYWPSSYWKTQSYFPIIWTEKRDLIKLFEPELPQAVRRFASKGQADVNSREANGLSMVRTMLQAAGRDAETPWLLWTKACEGLMATWPTLPRHPRDVERIADGCANHSLDAVRYGVMWWRAKWKTGSAKSRMGQIY